MSASEVNEPPSKKDFILQALMKNWREKLNCSKYALESDNLRKYSSKKPLMRLSTLKQAETSMIANLQAEVCAKLNR